MNKLKRKKADITIDVIVKILLAVAFLAIFLILFYKYKTKSGDLLSSLKDLLRFR
jgi:hypothetical protein